MPSILSVQPSTNLLFTSRAPACPRAINDWTRGFIGKTVNSDLYCQQLMRTERVWFFIMIMPDHTSLAKEQILGEFGWEVLVSPPCSPDLALSDFHLFRSLQNFWVLLAGILINIECRAWAQNIKYDKKERIGTIHFELMVE
ncbi:hypothetical protein EVAR_52261_1 [Eumeta japonica]|uniref:Uncharacterized protein n=1 Tax=Eumeta variegata TaxID=151549 RepID=A0A4C1YQB5_EUMVA|nr:hypothetical protein EVAR_52261_1 [Eumeta japonica]